MTRPLLILRPEPGNSKSVARAVAMGLSPLACPLFEVAAIPWEPPPSEQFDGLLLTSENALLCAGPALAAYLKLPVLAVGEATATAARQAGFSDVMAGTSDGADLLRKAGKRKLLYLSGANVTDVQHSGIERRIVYASHTIERPQGLDAALARHPVAAVHSARAAVQFAMLADEADTPRAAIALVTLSAKVAAAAGHGWEEVAIAVNPRDEDLLHAASQFIPHIKARHFS